MGGQYPLDLPVTRISSRESVPLVPHDHKPLPRHRLPCILARLGARATFRPRPNQKG